MDGNLIRENIIDHHILYKKVHIHNYDINIYSINIAQKSDLRTMMMFNKIQCFLKGGQRAIVDYSFFDRIPDLLLKYDYHLREVVEGDKVELKDEKFLKDLEKYTKRPFEKVFLRKYTPKDQFVTDSIFRTRFERTNFRYIDIIFEEEKLEHYRNRVSQVLKHLEHLSTGKDNVMFCFQEIKPIKVFLQESMKNKSWVLIDPCQLTVKQEKKSNNVLFVKNFPFKVKRLTTIKHDTILKIFNHEIFYEGEWVSQRNPNQNVKFYIPALKCFFYNIHSFLNEEKTIMLHLDKILTYLFARKSKFIIIGDLNFKLPTKTITKINNYLASKEIISSFIPSITNRKLKTYDGIIIKS